MWLLREGCCSEVPLSESSIVPIKAHFCLTKTKYCTITLEKCDAIRLSRKAAAGFKSKFQ